ncbi:tryptophan--tRNA ligase [Aquirufa sp. Wall-65K1]
MAGVINRLFYNNLKNENGNSNEIINRIDQVNFRINKLNNHFNFNFELCIDNNKIFSNIILSEIFELKKLISTENNKFLSNNKISGSLDFEKLDTIYNQTRSIENSLLNHLKDGYDYKYYNEEDKFQFISKYKLQNYSPVNIFVIPEAEISEHVMTIPGIDGQKMSKSLNNYIDVFLPEKDLLKQIKKIVTDTTPLEDPKNPDEDITFKLYQLIATPEQVAEMKANYLRGGYGYGHAKQALFEAMLVYFKEAREKFDYYMANPMEIEAKLEEGEARVKPIAEATIQRVREIFQF